MATFSKATFNAASYAAFRPTYPKALFDYVFRFHGAGTDGASWDTAVDLGCGTGQATVGLSPTFKNVVGTDPSAGMVDAARRATPNYLNGRVTYVQSPAEKLAFLSDGSVDLMVSAQAGHWFDWSKVWPEAARVLRRHGTFAIWTYSEPRLPKYPSLMPHFMHFFQGADLKTSIGPYWQQPGRSIVEGHLAAIPDATAVVPDAFTDFARCHFTGTYHDLPDPKPILMRQQTTWEGLHGYFRTSSGLHTFLEQNPEDGERPEGDLAMRFWKALMRGAEEQDGVAVGSEGVVEVEWPLSMILVRRA